MFYQFDELTSTIDEARDPKYSHGDIVAAERQTEGRGQRGKKWSSEPGENLTFSAVLDTSFVRVADQFRVLQLVAVALADTFAEWGLDARIKWTNDIYIGERKIVGVLIDHSHVSSGPPGEGGFPAKGGMLARSGAGIGINVNQTEFPSWLPNPTSMALELGQQIDRQQVLEEFHRLLMERYEALKSSGWHELERDYHSKIYRLGTPAQYALPDGTGFLGTILGVAPSGELRMETPWGTRKFLFHEVSFII